MSAGWPYSDTGRMARVRGVMRSATRRASRLPVAASTSTNTGVAPTSNTASAAAMNENGVVITSSPALMPSAIRAMTSASVPEDTVMQWRAPVRAASRASSSATSGPRMYWPWSRTAWMRSLIRAREARYWDLRSMNSMAYPRVTLLLLLLLLLPAPAPGAGAMAGPGFAVAWVAPPVQVSARPRQASAPNDEAAGRQAPSCRT